VFGKSRKRNTVINTLIGEGARIEGDLRFEGGCHIDGVVHGNVIAVGDEDDILSISEGGRVEGNVRVPCVSLNGTVQGDLYAADRVELGATARVVGNVYYELLEMAAGAEINGKLIHGTALAPTGQARPPSSAPEATQPITPEAVPKAQG